MSFFTELKQQLIQQLQSLSKQSGLIELNAKVCLNNETPLASTPNLLGWLKGQTTFPQFFWQSRDQTVSFATIGVVHQFSELNEAQNFSQQSGFRLFGGVKFEGECQFILPRLVLVKNNDQLTAYLYLTYQEKSHVSELLKTFTQIEQLCDISNRLVKQEKVSDFFRWEQLIQQAIQAIKQQQFRKVVLANATTLSFEQAISPYDLLNASQKQNQGCYHFLWSENPSSAFIGSSPERLYQRIKTQLQTEALAGTVAVTNDIAQTERYRLWLLSDQKNIYENQLVVDDIQQRLSKQSEQIKINEIEIKRLHNVQHLRRKIHAILHPTTTDLDCITQIHPTAAVAGLPRPLALNFIMNHEGFIRGWYAGSLGSLSPEDAEFCVALRSAQVLNHQITLYAGAGIVEDSQPLSEWEEIERKALALGKLLPH